MLIKCKQCGTEFDFTEKEQEWYQNKFGDEYSPPKYCKPCRDARKQEKVSGGVLQKKGKRG
jgi:hypothetical protein